MNKQKIAILGIGRSGMAVARAAKAMGAEPKIFDAKAPDDPTIQDAIRAMQKEGIPVACSWTGNFNPQEVDTLVVSPGVDMRSPMLRSADASGIEVIGEIEFAFRISKAHIIGITGTNGKSTTTVMTWQCLKTAGQDAILCGNIYGSGYDEMPLTEAAFNSREGQVLVAEISSFQLEWVKDFRPRCAAVTNISPDHLNRYDGFEQYADAKKRLFARMGEGDTIVANVGDITTYPGHIDVKDLPRGLPRVRFYGSAGVDASFDSNNFKVSVGLPLDSLSFKEKHNLQNACLAALLALSFLESVDPTGDQFERIKRVTQGLKDFKGLAHRMEKLGGKGGVNLINNSMCTNPAAVVASSHGVPGKQHLLIGGIRKGLDFETVGNHLQESGHKAYLFGTDAAEINGVIGGNWPVFNTLNEAFAAAAAEAKDGETIMLAPGCASMDQFTDFRARGEEFKRIAKEWLSDDKGS